MHNPLDHFWARAKDLRLTNTEKDQGRALLETGMKLLSQGDSLTLSRKERAEGFDRLAQALTDRPIMRETLFDTIVRVLNSSVIRVPVTAVFVFVVGSGALAAAAEGALPGDPLYAVKISFTEPILGAFRKTSTKDSAEWNMLLLERRLDEVEAIATTPEARKRVDPAAKALREQTSEFLQAVDTMLPGEENEELRRAAVRQFDARANFVTNRHMDEQTTHQIIRAMLDEQRRIERASRSASSAVSSMAPPAKTSTGSVRGQRSSSSSSDLRDLVEEKLNSLGTQNDR